MSLYCSESPGCLCRTCLYWWSSRCPYGCLDECRGGIFTQRRECEKYVEIDNSKTRVNDCLEAVVVRYQDGYISCSLVDTTGCEECYKRFQEKIGE